MTGRCAIVLLAALLSPWAAGEAAVDHPHDAADPPRMLARTAPVDPATALWTAPLIDLERELAAATDGPVLFRQPMQPRLMHETLFQPFDRTRSDQTLLPLAVAQDEVPLRRGVTLTVRTETWAEPGFDRFDGRWDADGFEQPGRAYRASFKITFGDGCD